MAEEQPVKDAMPEKKKKKKELKNYLDFQV